MTESKLIQDFEKMKTETSQQNIKDKKFNYINNQEVGERKSNKPINQDHQNSSFSSSLTTKYHKVKKIFHQFCNKFSLQPHNVIIGMIFILIIVIICNNMPRNVKPLSLRNFAEDVNWADISANMIQNSIAFGFHDTQIANALHKFGEKIRKAGHLLQNMYSEGFLVYHLFEIEAKSSIRQGDAKYFKDELITKLKEFRKLVEKTHWSIIDAEISRNDAESYILDGLRVAKVFVVNNCHSNRYYNEDINGCYIAKRDLYAVNYVLGHLYDTAHYLNKIEMILDNYAFKLFDVSAEFGEGIEVTKMDLLKFAVKSSLYKLEEL